MKIAAFDLGSNLAVAHNLLGGPISATVEFTGHRTKRARDTLGWFQAFFAEAALHGGLDAVVYERPFARGMDATRCLWGIAGLLEAVAADAGIQAIDITPSEIKKHAGGKGVATKEDMILFASLTGYGGDNEHEADAWCLLRWAEDNLRPQRTDKKGKRRGR